jgi:hypothetical protein
VGFLPIFYVGFFCFIALAVYTALAIVAGLDSLGKRLAAAVLAFGASSGIGAILIAVSLSLFEKPGASSTYFALPSKTGFVLVYVLPGLLGAGFTFAWMSKRKKSS